MYRSVHFYIRWESTYNCIEKIFEGITHTQEVKYRYSTSFPETKYLKYNNKLIIIKCRLKNSDKIQHDRRHISSTFKNYFIK